jgi:cytochrome c553
MTRRLGRLAMAAALTVLGMAGDAAAADPLGDVGAMKAITCSACHGVAGNSRSDAMPIIAGLDPAYFKRQMEAYAGGKRPSPEMEPYAKEVLDLGVDDIAAYFGRQKMEPTPIRVSPAAVERGRAAAAQCVLCHGQDGKGDRAKLIPSLTGQPPGYLTTQMILFKQDRRNPGDPNLAALKALMKGIPNSTFDDLAAYYSSLR